MFDFSPYGTKTTNEVLKIVENLKFKGYTLLKQKNSFGNYPYLENFFIFKKANKNEYLRVILKSTGWNEEKLFYWNVEFSFKPYNYKHNHKTGNNWNSGKFKGNEENLYLKGFLEAVKQIKLNKSVLK